MDKKSSFIFFPAEFLSAIHNFRKSQVADLIIALCEINYYGDLSIKLSEPVKKRLETLQATIDKNNAKYKEICEKRQANGSKGGSKRQAKSKQSSSNHQAKVPLPHTGESENENESDNEYDNGNKDKVAENVDKSGFAGAPTVDEVAAYAQKSGYTIDPVAFVKWNEERGWMNGKKYIAVDWRKAVRKWFYKENGLSPSEMEPFSDVCADMLGKVKAVHHES